MEPVSELSIRHRLTKVLAASMKIRQSSSAAQDCASQRRALHLVEERRGGREGAAREGEGGVDGIPLALHTISGRLLVGVGNSVRIYDMGKKKLLRELQLKWECASPHLYHP